MENINVNYKKYIDVYETLNKYKVLKQIPPVVHRILLYDKTFPNNTIQYLNKFGSVNYNFTEVLWNEIDVLSIMDCEEKEIYNSYSHKIQKSDFARYIILKYCGGIYCDFDIDVKLNFSIFYERYKNGDLFFEETTLTDEFQTNTKKFPIRNGKEESKLRIANYIMMSIAGSKSIQYIIDTCFFRKDLEIKTDYDIIYTTGPDVVSECFSNFNSKYLYLTKNECDICFEHMCLGHWRF